MDKEKRKELQEEYSRIKTIMGVIQIKNKINGKVYIDSYPNLKNKWLNLQSQLETGRHMSSSLQKDWKEFGKDAFTYEVLEEKEADDVIDRKWELQQMEKKWLEKLQPFGEKGYNNPPVKRVNLQA